MGRTPSALPENAKKYARALSPRSSRASLWSPSLAGPSGGSPNLSPRHPSSDAPPPQHWPGRMQQQQPGVHSGSRLRSHKCRPHPALWCRGTWRPPGALEGCPERQLLVGPRSPRPPAPPQLRHRPRQRQRSPLPPTLAQACEWCKRRGVEGGVEIWIERGQKRERERGEMRSG